MNDGARPFNAGTVSRKSVASASSVFGGKNSNEIVGSGQAYSSGTRKRSTSLRLDKSAENPTEPHQKYTRSWKWRKRDLDDDLPGIPALAGARRITALIARQRQIVRRGL